MKRDAMPLTAEGLPAADTGWSDVPSDGSDVPGDRSLDRPLDWFHSLTPDQYGALRAEIDRRAAAARREAVASFAPWLGRGARRLVQVVGRLARSALARRADLRR